MKYATQDGRRPTIPAPSGGVVSGQMVIVGSLIGVAEHDAAEGEPVTIDTTFCGDFPKVSALAIAVGDKLYYDSAAKVVNKTASGNTLVGISVGVSPNPSEFARLKLGATTV